MVAPAEAPTRTLSLVVLLMKEISLLASATSEAKLNLSNS